MTSLTAGYHILATSQEIQAHTAVVPVVGNPGGRMLAI